MQYYGHNNGSEHIQSKGVLEEMHIANVAYTLDKVLKHKAVAYISEMKAERAIEKLVPLYKIGRSANSREIYGV